MFVSVSARKKIANAIFGGIRMFLHSRALKSHCNIEKIQPRMMCASVNGNSSTTIISSYRPTDASDERDITTFYNQLSSLDRHIPEHNTLIIGVDMNAQIGKDENKFCWHNSSNRNRVYLIDFSMEYQNPILHSRKGRENYGCTPIKITWKKTWKYKWINSALKCEV